MSRIQNATAALVPSARPALPAALPPLARGPLPRAQKVLAVIARPGQESADLGALLYALRRGGASLALLCVTRGEASPLNATCERLETRRPWELLVAGAVIGISSFTVADYPDGGLTGSPLAELTELVQRSAAAAHASQSEALPEVERRLGLLGSREALRWLVPACTH